MSKLLVITNSDLANGFRLAGVETVIAEDADQAEEMLLGYLDDDEVGIIAINDTYVSELKERVRHRIEQIYKPVVITIPTKTATRPEEQRSYQLSEMIRRSVGIRITFGE